MPEKPQNDASVSTDLENIRCKDYGNGVNSLNILYADINVLGTLIKQKTDEIAKLYETIAIIESEIFRRTDIDKHWCEIHPNITSYFYDQIGAKIANDYRYHKKRKIFPKKRIRKDKLMYIVYANNICRIGDYGSNDPEIALLTDDWNAAVAKAHELVKEYTTDSSAHLDEEWSGDFTQPDDANDGSGSSAIIFWDKQENWDWYTEIRITNVEKNKSYLP